MSDVVGNAGGVVSIEVFPAIPARFVAGSIVHFEKPMGEFLIEPGSIQKKVRSGAKRRCDFLQLRRFNNGQVNFNCDAGGAKRQDRQSGIALHL